MSKPDTKRIKTDNDPEYELIYWPGIPGRGELIRVLFEEAGVPYKDTAKDENQGAAVANVLNQMESKDSPIFACPALRHKDNLFFQTANILMYIAPKLGLAPTESSIASFHLNQIVLTILDGLVAEAHDTHHPVSVGLTYEEQKPEAKKKAKAFTQERLPKFLAYLQRVIDANSMSGDELWLYGSTLTYADLVLFQGLDGTKFAFPNTVQKLQESGKYDGVFKLYETIKERPNIKAYLSSNKRTAYSEGIWRQYPELDE